MGNPLISDLEEIQPQLDIDAVYSQILSQYSEPGREYFTIQRAALIRKIFLDYIDEMVEDPEPNNVLQSKFAIWFKHSVKDPVSLTNNEDSANLAQELLKGSYNINTRNLKAVMLAFENRNVMPYSITSFAIDAENSILGSHPETYFGEYLPNLRSEYGVLSNSVWNKKRTRFIEKLLGGDKLFFNTILLEDRARENLTKELILLKSETNFR